ncbi:Beta-galactosidase/beta-glucuronidase [Treponema sp. JC4]|uniref:glycoside hydrolase family 2 TIM barrel-domain containing protein n=1 Tax=Treponema sp. JC4 TaxID=1124982 RepID=UPI00025B0C2C|nr:glycoside hydrolase family 2 TIM barrel-domain containing protein [Treponema sp. JC4]EID85356.1 Beta-galactosidase/beta-glucuronidase [Treponema sp. JC4]
MKNFYENPEIQSLNRLPSRSHLIPFADAKSSIIECAEGPESHEKTESSFVKYLDGKWDFAFSTNPELSFNDVNKWDKINVPGTWSLQGWDKPHYTNVQMPFDTIPPNVPEENPTGLYRLKVKIPSEWKGRRVVLHIGSAESVTQVFVNGIQAGISKDTRLPCEFDISYYIKDAVAEGKEVTIDIKVIRYSDASFVEDQDQWWFGGIHRSVYLYTTEDTYIADVSALSHLEEAGPVIAADVDGIKNAFHEDKKTKGYKAGDKATGIIPLYVTLGRSDLTKEISRFNHADNDKFERVVKYAVYELDGSVQKGSVGKQIAEGWKTGTLCLRLNLNQIRSHIKIENPKLWSHEHPNLYLVCVSLHESDGGKPGRHIESVCFTTGFKSVQIKNRELLINGKMVYIKGVNRHEHSEVHGKTLTTAEMVKDLHIMKSYNFNAVRTCHYPDDERWYELCNRYGMYVLDEANIENHANYDVITRNDEWTNAYMQRIMRMVRRDKNNVCIFGWSLGNESGDGQNQVAAQAWIRRVDPTRLVHYEGFVRPPFTQGDFSLDSLSRGKGLTDLIGPMYPSIALIKEYATSREDYRPIIMCEYSHAMGNANGSLGDYWRAIYSTHGLQGGFIWDWIDQGLAAEAPLGADGQPQGGKYWKYGGDFGDKPSDYDFCLNGIMFPDQTTKPAMEECKKIFAPIFFRPLDAANGKYEVENRFDFTSLDNVKLIWNILKNGCSVKKGEVHLGDSKVLPGEKKEISIPTGDFTSKADGEYLLNVQFAYKNETSFSPAGWIFGLDEVLLNKVDLSKALFNQEAGVEEGTLNKLAKELTPELFRSFTENECVKRELNRINENPLPFSLFNKPTVEWLKKDLPNEEVKADGKGGFEIFTGSKAEKKEKLADVKLSYESVKSPAGSPAVKVTADFELTPAMAEYPRAGLCLKIPAEYDRVNWYGRGPQECYSDRKDGALLGLYSKKACELEVPYIVPQENGSRCDTRYLYLEGEGVKPLHIQSEAPFSFNYSRYTEADLWKCEHRSELTPTCSAKNGYYTLHLDAVIRGVGTGACGPDTLAEYKIMPGKYKLEFIIY